MNHVAGAPSVSAGPYASPAAVPGIGRPAASALTEAGIDSFETLARQTERQLLALHGMGPKAIGLLKQALSEIGASFAPDASPQSTPKLRLATFRPAAGDFQARFTAALPHPAETIWPWITQQHHLDAWFAALRAQQIAVGGKLRVDMGGGAFEDMEILACDPPSALAYSWFDGTVLFSLSPMPGGCQLRFARTFSTPNSSVAEDLASWHLRLAALIARLEGAPVPDFNVAWPRHLARAQAAMQKLLK